MAAIRAHLWPNPAGRGPVLTMFRNITTLCAALAITLALQGCGDRSGAPAGRFSLDAPLPEKVPPGVQLVIGDPITQAVLEHNGWDKDLPFKVEWAQMAGGPQVTEAFHAKALDVGTAANVPPIHAVWVGIPVKIIAVQFRKRDSGQPSWRLGISPKAKVNSLADLRGKKIAFSAGQVQGEVVLRTLKDQGLKKSDVTLVELPSTGDVYINALVAGLVDVAPLGSGGISQRYIRDFARNGAKLLDHSQFRDDLGVVYTRTEILEDPGKAAALRAYVQIWARARQWIAAHQSEWAECYYKKNQGLSSQEALQIVRAQGAPDIPANWSEAVKHQQATIDLFAEQNGTKHFDAGTLFDRRFESVAADAAHAEAALYSAPREKAR